MAGADHRCGADANNKVRWSDSPVLPQVKPIAITVAWDVAIIYVLRDLGETSVSGTCQRSANCGMFQQSCPGQHRQVSCVHVPDVLAMSPWLFFDNCLLTARRDEGRDNVDHTKQHQRGRRQTRVIQRARVAQQ